MGIIIDLTPEEEARLTAEAQSKGLQPAELAARFLRERIGTPLPVESDPLLSLFAQWAEEDATMTPAEIADENRQWEELKSSLNTERDRAGARRVL